MNEGFQGEGTYTYICKNRDCWYCEIMNPVVQVAHKSHDALPEKVIRWRVWTNAELELLLAHIDESVFVILKLFPGRTAPAINGRKYVLRQSLGLKAQPRRRTYGGFA